MSSVRIGLTRLPVFALLAWAGCGQDDGRVAVYPVSGKILVRGQPAVGAQVVFYPASTEIQGPGMPIPAAETDADGEFQLRSFEPEDGAPAGKFDVTVIWREPIPPNVDQEMYQPKDRLAGRYSDPKTSGLTATVEEGGGELPPFELK
jgi:hypothetical protein